MSTKITILLSIALVIVTSCGTVRTATSASGQQQNSKEKSMPDYRAGFVNDARDTLYLPANSFGGQICDSWDIDPTAQLEKWPVFVFVGEDEIERLWYERKGLVVQCIRCYDSITYPFSSTNSASVQLSSKQSTNK